MAHPDREKWAIELARQLTPQTHVEIAWDTQNSVWDTARRALNSARYLDTTHWLVLQDDAILCQDLIAGVEQALRYIPPSSSLSLYLGSKRPFHVLLNTLLNNGHRKDISFVRMNRVNWGVGVVYPSIQIPQIFDYLEARGSDTKTVRYDLHITNWFLHKSIPVYYTWPSLIDHRASRSLMDHGDLERQAFRFLGADKSALDVDWTKGFDFVQIAGKRP